MISYYRNILLLLMVLFSSAAHAMLAPERPEPGTFIQDTQSLISSEDQALIRIKLAKLNEERQIPIIVVTIDRLSKYTGGENLSIEDYARKLFNHWGIGHGTHNYGVLLLVSKHDRKTRIQFGGGWGFLYDGQAQRIMDRSIIPLFKAGQYSEGIKAGILELDELARKDLVFLVDMQKVLATLLVFALLAGTMTSLMIGDINHKGMKFQKYYAGTVGLLYIATFALHWIGFFNHIEVYTIMAGYVVLTLLSLLVYAPFHAKSGAKPGTFLHILVLLAMIVFIPILLMAILFKINESDDEFNSGSADMGGGATGEW